MRTYYFARRIPIRASEDECLSIRPDMTAREVHACYVGKTIHRETHISNGPWILRPFAREGTHETNRLPPDVTPYGIWEMVRDKIADSSAVIALVDSKSYGTIAEVNYAAGLRTIAVYVLPAAGISEDEKTDLWLSFQAALETSSLWQEEDIQNVRLFAECGIHSLEDYRGFIAAIVPKFLRRDS